MLLLLLKLFFFCPSQNLVDDKFPRQKKEKVPCEALLLIERKAWTARPPSRPQHAHQCNPPSGRRRAAVALAAREVAGPIVTFTTPTHALPSPMHQHGGLYLNLIRSMSSCSRRLRSTTMKYYADTAEQCSWSQMSRTRLFATLGYASVQTVYFGYSFFLLVASSAPPRRHK